MRAKTLELSGWGRVAPTPAAVWRPERMAEAPRALAAATAAGYGALARGGGRSYGDQAQNDGGAVISMDRLDRICAFDPATGAVAVEAGVSFRELIRALGPRGFLPPTAPGGGFATIAGGVANDVHGKNHDRVGSFGDHVDWFDLLLADGETRRVDADSDPELFAATIGGCGLTGIILRVGFRMAPAASSYMVVDERRLGDLDALMAALAEARESARYSVAWIDCAARGARLGRGVLETARIADAGTAPRAPAPVGGDRAMPFNLPGAALNRFTVGAFNELYWRRIPPAGRRTVKPVESFLFPLDAILSWNRLYGRRGFYQFQCVAPDETAAETIPRLMTAVSDSGRASFLAVLKTLGGAGRGMLSFPMRGWTLALDLPRRPGVEDVLARLERIARDAGGRVYLAKDAALSAEAFRAMYPKHDAFCDVLARVDPAGRWSSDMARRLGLRAAPGRARPGGTPEGAQEGTPEAGR